ncbi:hypothetical protein QTP88_005582 [Uroleucon formosanum]
MQLVHRGGVVAAAFTPINCIVPITYILIKCCQTDNLPHLPPRVPKRDKDKTVIGVPKKRKLTSKLLPFEELPVDIRHYEMLRWFVNDSIAKSAVYENKSVHEKDIEIIPERVSNAIMDKAIAIDEIKCYLTEGSWLAIQQVIKMKKLTPTWIYPICAKDAATESICCVWFLKSIKYVFRLYDNVLSATVAASAKQYTIPVTL